MRENKNRDSIADALDIEPVTANVPEQVKVVSSNPPDDLQADYEAARENLHNVIIKGQDALGEMLVIAKQSESPRAFEVVSTLMKTITDANKDLINLSKQRQDIVNNFDDDMKTEVTNNNLFVGSTTDLISLLKQQEQSKKKIKKVKPDGEDE